MATGLEVTNALEFRSQLYPVEWFVHLLEAGQLNMAPEFQRKSVWSLGDRKKLVSTVLQGWPVPAVFLRKRIEGGRSCFDVLDGKQRLETLFMFTGARGYGRQGFEARWDDDQNGRAELWNWAQIRRHHGEARIMGYQIPLIEVECESLATVVDLFVRINSTGKPLTGAEKRHARFSRSSLLAACKWLSRRNERYLLQHRVLSEAQFTRMKDSEFFAELLVSMHRGAPSNRKEALDRVLAQGSIDGRELARLKRECHQALVTVRRLLPEVESTRLSNLTDYYSLVLAVWQLQRKGLVLKGSRPLRAAEKLLRNLARQVDVAQQGRIDRDSSHFSSDVAQRYLSSVESASDNAHQRAIRHEILCELLEGCFETKDPRRGFSRVERRLLWNSTRKPECAVCEVELRWDNFQIDHIRPHSRGGRTKLDNAQLTCASCNASKGARPRGHHLVS